METETYVFIIIDGGHCKKVIVEKDLNELEKLARAAIEDYLTDHGFGSEEQEELATEDGYAKIVKAIPGNPDSDECICSYSFDGEVSLNYAFCQIN